MALIEVRLRPAGPWRVGHPGGDRERVDVIYHSDALFSAITHAMRVLGWLDEWLDATARADASNPAAAPAVRFSSLFPFIGKTRLISPPRTAWPPANPGKLYLQGMKLVPLEVARGAALDETRWRADGASECLVPAGAGSPFQVSLRSAAAVDRLTGAAEPHRTACLEFAANAGWWGLFDAADAVWEARVKSAFRLLADSGFGGERSRGWGRAAEPSFSTAASLFPENRANGSWWLLSMYSPRESDNVDWTRGEYSASVRGGWTDSPAGAGQKKSVRMIDEGSVVWAEAPRGRAVDVAPEGFPHPVYRSGFALAVPVPEPKKAIPGAEPVVAEEVPAEPALVEPEPAELAPTEFPAEPEPAPTEPEPAEPEPTGFPAEPAAAEPEPTEPASMEPAPTEPAPVEPAPAEPAAPTQPPPNEEVEP